LKAGASGNSFPIGKGPFVVTSSSDEKLLLKRVDDTLAPGKVQEVEILKFTPELKIETLDDPNHVYQIDLSFLEESGFSKRNIPSAKTYGLFLALKDHETRRRIVNCIDFQKLVEALPVRINRSNSIIPPGFLGFREQASRTSSSKNPITCSSSGSSPLQNIRFVDPISNLKLRAIVKSEALAKQGLIYIAENSEKTLSRFENREELVMVFAISADLDMAGAQKDSSWAVDFVAGKTSYFPSKVPELEKLFLEIQDSKSYSEKDILFAKAEDIIKKENIYLPLGQLKAEQYYSKRIKSFSYANLASGFIDISSVTLDE
jgi:hypothetical protein